MKSTKTFFASAFGGFVALLLAMALGGGFFAFSTKARDSVQEWIYNSIVLRAGTEATAGTNGFFTFYRPNGTNFTRNTTNGNTIYYLPSGSYTSFTGFLVFTNPIGGGWNTNIVIDGRLCSGLGGSTNNVGATPPTL